MKRKTTVLAAIIWLFMSLGLSAQTMPANDDVKILPLPFNSPATDFGVAVVEGGLLITSDRGDEGMFRTEAEKTPLDIFFVERRGEGMESWGSPRPAKGIVNTKVVDGFPSLTEDGKTMFFARNIVFEGSVGAINNTRNKLGIFQAKLVGDQWQEVVPFPHNSSEYNLLHPTVSPDGTILFFASDMEGGQGETDLYQSTLVNGQWTAPQNLGPVVNSSGSDSFPFYHPDGTLYFSSNGHPGFGQMDVFRTMLSEGDWAAPVNLGAPLNDATNEVGYITDINHQLGYLASDKEGDFNIYGVEMLSPVFFGCKYPLKNNHCYTFFEEGTTLKQGIPATYQWVFGDGNSALGLEVEHCYTTEGNFEVVLNVIDSITGEIYSREATYALPIKDHEQVVITTSADTVRLGQNIDFDGKRTNYPGLEIKEYYWDFADGARKRGESVNHSFTKPGIFLVQLGILANKPGDAANEVKQCGIKKIIVLTADGKAPNKGETEEESQKGKKKPKKKKK